MIPFLTFSSDIVIMEYQRNCIRGLWFSREFTVRLG